MGDVAYIDPPELEGEPAVSFEPDLAGEALPEDYDG